MAEVLRLDGPGNARELVDEIAAVVEAAAVAVGQVSEATLSDRIEGSVRAMSATLSALVAQLPEGPEECSRLLQTWRAIAEQSQGARQMLQDAEALDEYARRFDLMPWSVAIEEVPQNMSAEEAQQVILLVRSALSDVHAALSDVSRDEIEELADVALTVARMAISMAQRVSRQMRSSVEREAEHGVVIEDVTDGPAAATIATPTSAPEPPPPPVPRLRPATERLLWRPLWPRAMEWAAAPSLSPLKARLQAVPVWLWLVVVVFWPVSLFLGFAFLWILAWSVPVVFIADAVLQRVYVTRQEEIDDLIDGVVQVVRLWYLTVRLAARRGARVVRSQVRRALAGRSLREAVGDWVANPGASIAAAARLASAGAAASWRAIAGTASASGAPPALRSAGAQVCALWRQLAAF